MWKKKALEKSVVGKEKALEKLVGRVKTLKKFVVRVRGKVWAAAPGVRGPRPVGGERHRSC